jgi:hypothetical protein
MYCCVWHCSIWVCMGIRPILGVNACNQRYVKVPRGRGAPEITYIVVQKLRRVYRKKPGISGWPRSLIRSQTRERETTRRGVGRISLGTMSEFPKWRLEFIKWNTYGFWRPLHRSSFWWSHELYVVCEIGIYIGGCYVHALFAIGTQALETRNQGS